MRTRFLVMTLVLAAACAPAKPTCPMYSLAIANCSGADISGVRVQFGDLVDQPGIIVNEAHKGMLVEGTCPPATADVTWRTEGAPQVHSATVKVGEVLPSDFGSDEVVMQICPNEVVEVFARPSAFYVHPVPGTWRDAVPAKQGCCAEKGSSGGVEAP